MVGGNDVQNMKNIFAAKRDRFSCRNTATDAGIESNAVAINANSAAASTNTEIAGNMGKPERLLASYKQSLTTYLNVHKRPDWELGVGGGYAADAGEYSMEVQRNYSSKNAVAVEYLGGNVKGFLEKIKILF